MTCSQNRSLSQTVLCCLCAVYCFEVGEINWAPPQDVRIYMHASSISFLSCCELIIHSLPCDGSALHRVPPSLLTQESCLPTTSPPMMTHTELNSPLFITSHQPPFPTPLFISPDLLTHTEFGQEHIFCSCGSETNHTGIKINSRDLVDGIGMHHLFYLLFVPLQKLCSSSNFTVYNSTVLFKSLEPLFISSRFARKR